MIGSIRARKFSFLNAWVLTLLFLIPFGCAPKASGPSEQAAAGKSKKKIDVFQVLVANEDKSDKGTDKAYRFAGVIIDRSRKVKRNETTAEVKVVNKLPSGRNAGKDFDVVFVARPGEIKNGKILTLTSSPVASCRPFLKKFLTKTLSPKRITKAYKGAKLATVDKDKTAKSLAQSLAKNGWLRDCK